MADTVDVLAPEHSPSARWTIEIVLCSLGVSHDVLDLMGSYQLTLRESQPQGPFWTTVTVA